MQTAEPAQFYLNSGERILIDRGFLTHVANLLEHNSFEVNSCDAVTATEYANELWRVLFASRNNGHSDGDQELEITERPGKRNGR